MQTKLLVERVSTIICPLICGSLLAVLHSGCAVLTKTQVGEVATFAQATKDYGTLPGEPIKMYGNVLALDKLLQVSARRYEVPIALTNAWLEMQTALKRGAEFDAIATQADQALAILDTYSELLTKLSSDDFMDALDKSAQDLGGALDKDIAQYNKTFREPRGKDALKASGSIVAEIVRGAGGIFIRNRQAVWLKEYVIKADPLIVALMDDIHELLGKKLKADFVSFRDRLQDDFMEEARVSGKLPLSTVLTVSDIIAKTDKAIQLCDAADTSATQYAQAHSELVKELMERKKLKAHIQEIITLANEIKAARKLKNISQDQ